MQFVVPWKLVTCLVYRSLFEIPPRIFGNIRTLINSYSKNLFCTIITNSTVNLTTVNTYLPNRGAEVAKFVTFVFCTLFKIHNCISHVVTHCAW